MSSLFMFCEAQGGAGSFLSDFFNADRVGNALDSFIYSAAGLLMKLVLAVIIWKVGKFAIGWLVKISARGMERSGLDVGASKFICSVLKFVCYAVVAMVILDILGFQTSSFIAVIGSAALAISMSLQGSLSNFAGGILILIFKPFRVGDYICVNDCEGTVEFIDMLYTKVKTADNRVIMMPNGALSNSNIINVGAEGIRRLDISIGIGYGSDVTKAKNILREIMENYPPIDKNKEITVIVKSLEDSCVLLEARAWVKHDTYWDTRFVLLEKFKQEFDKNDIEIPFNQLDVHVRQ